jgi:hypothetical protein
MTDFASQGKTRPFNVADLNNLSTHQAYYTALSRSATAGGTLILQGFDPRNITGGCSGALRQEFRELELLDEITLCRYMGRLRETVYGPTRNQGGAGIEMPDQGLGRGGVRRRRNFFLEPSITEPQNLDLSARLHYIMIYMKYKLYFQDCNS